MKTSERIEDILTAGIFTPDEVEPTETPNTFKSICYYLIIHLTDEELYYTDGETLKAYEDTADMEQDTPKGRIFLFS